MLVALIRTLLGSARCTRLAVLLDPALAEPSRVIGELNRALLGAYAKVVQHNPPLTIHKHSALTDADVEAIADAVIARISIKAWDGR